MISTPQTEKAVLRVTGFTRELSGAMEAVTKFFEEWVIPPHLRISPTTPPTERELPVIPLELTPSRTRRRLDPTISSILRDQMTSYDLRHFTLTLVRTTDLDLPLEKPLSYSTIYRAMVESRRFDLCSDEVIEQLITGSRSPCDEAIVAMRPVKTGSGLIRNILHVKEGAVCPYAVDESEGMSWHNELFLCELNG